jgi:sugar/nucleoside kinase (ribokinase family)
LTVGGFVVSQRADVKRTSGLDAVIAGLAVVDIIGRPVDLSRPPQPGSLQIIDSVTLTTGGNVSNTGIDLAKMGFKVGAIARVGDDGLGQFIRQQYEAHGLRTSGVIVDSRKQTSTTIATVAADGERTFFHTRGCVSNFSVRDVLAHLDLIGRAQILGFGYLGLLPECEPGLARLFRTIKKETGVRILLDTGGAPKKNTALLRAVLPFVDIFIPSYDEAVVLTGKTRPEDIARTLRHAGASGVVGVKMGARGCFIVSADAALYVPAVRVKKVVDATGAGDAFVAGFLAATLRGFDPFAAAHIANAVAASCVTAVGASTAIKRFEDYETRIPHRFPFSLG